MAVFLFWGKLSFHVWNLEINHLYLPVSEGLVWFSTAMDVPHPMLMLLECGHESDELFWYSSSFSIQNHLSKNTEWLFFNTHGYYCLIFITKWKWQEKRETLLEIKAGSHSVSIKAKEDTYCTSWWTLICLLKGYSKGPFNNDQSLEREHMSETEVDCLSLESCGNIV